MAGSMTTTAKLERFMGAWFRADLEALVGFLADDCLFEASVGPEPGATYVGRADVRRGFARVLGLDPETGRGSPAPTQEREAFVFVAGDRGHAEWSYSQVGSDGVSRRVHGCDIFEFDGDKISRKSAFRKVPE